MEYMHAVLLLHNAKKEINEENLKTVLKAAGIEPDEGKIKAIIAALENVNIEEAIKQGFAMPAAAPAEEKKEEKKEEEKEEKKEVEASAGLAALFG